MTIRILDLYSGAGGCARGYYDALGPDVEIVGVDVNPQPNYPYTFVQDDADTYPLDGYDLIHASPPCQAFTALRVMGNANPNHRDHLTGTRARLLAHGAPHRPPPRKAPMTPETPRLTRHGAAAGPWTAVGTEPIDTDRFGSRRTVVYGTIDRALGVKTGLWSVRIATQTPPAHGYRDFTLDHGYTGLFATRTEAAQHLLGQWRIRHHDRLTIGGADTGP